MMIQEFTDRTGFYPSADLYQAIEEAYYDFDGEKDAFCKAYKENRDGLAENIQRNTNNRSWKKHREQAAELTRRDIEIDGLKGQIKALEDKIDREQEWNPWTNERAVKQEHYDKLRNDGTSHEMTDAEAIEWIAGEWGFDPSKILIHRTMKTYEVNRHHQLRATGEIDRTPYYDATDWYYVFFSVCGMGYEAYNGSLNQI